MARIDLTISPSYVLNWGFWEAFREIFQNMIDNKISNGNDYFLNYADKKLVLGSRKTVLEKSTLLLGNTSKRGDEKLIGQYGEGYKLALLILVRSGKNITIYNGNEIWKPRLVKSRKFKSELLTIDVEKSNVRHDDLVFIIEGVSKEEYDSVMERTLYYHKDVEKIETPYGDILLDEKYRRKVFVEGLYVNTMNVDKMKYGYNVKSKYLELDRDRMSVTSFNLFWETGKMFAYLINNDDEEFEWALMHLIQNNYDDVQYVHQNSCQTNLYNKICETSYQNFVKVYGGDAMLVKNDQEAELVKLRYNNVVPVVVEQQKYEWISKSKGYKSSSVVKNEITPYQIMNGFLNKYLDDLSGDILDDVMRLVDKSRNWKDR